MANILYENGFPIKAVVNGKLVDVQEVRHGRWDFDEYGWVCSVCESPISVRYGKKNYCPNCGAKMDGDTE